MDADDWYVAVSDINLGPVDDCFTLNSGHNLISDQGLNCPKIGHSLRP